jgi:hypothetical protein
MEYTEIVIGLVAVFGFGVFVGDRTASRIDAAIAKIQAAETEAKALIAKITAHKAG